MIKKIITLFKLGRKISHSDILEIISKFQKPPLAITLLFKFLAISFSTKKKNLIKTIGFQQLKNFLIKKNNDIEKSSELAIQATRNYAKRQFTWFRHQFKANVTLKKNYDKKTKKYILKEINDKLLTN